MVVSDHDGINRLMEQGQKMRTVGATAMNATSSRSHSIFTIVVEMNDVDDAGKDHIRVGKVIPRVVIRVVILRLFTLQNRARHVRNNAVVSAVSPW